MAQNLGLPPTVEFNIDNHIITIKGFNADEAKQNLYQQAVNIIASGPSIVDLAFAEMQDTATIFVNGSISLTEQHEFTNIVGYVISDARFIHHQPEILKSYYTGQPLYATLAVLEAMAVTQPDLMRTYHDSMRILYPVDRPWGVKSNKLWFSKLSFRKKLLNKKKPLLHFVNHPNFVIDTDYKPDPIGVSLNITYGFVEAGTVAYVAAQLAFSRQASEINLYGVDLLNSNQPRFYENEDNSAPSKLDKAVTDRIVPSFNLLGHVYKDHGVPIINHSPISKDLFDGLY
ncbi:hypothetical protein ES754_02815 [Psychrobacter frigidicola]|uniref:Uncharacterized protein n=1 Tax=Psychrobacter frigidicola TaxID=45611 RepID=A0A5C7A5R8_9GAMM|nr:hypothetical protein [Psychrobacter frigidicola]TXD97904.1 hypothetical protein ES754_02815 [Psychrobacter frigidicola]